MAYTQQYIPIIARETKKILGLYNLGANVVFTGAETTYALAAGNIPVELWVPTPHASNIRKINPAFMASVWEHTPVFNLAYQGYGEFVHVQDALPATEQGSSSGVANWIREYLGPILEGLSESFGVGIANLVPINQVIPVLSGTVHSENVLTASNGTWVNTPTSYTYQWYRSGQPMPGATAATFTIRLEDVAANLYCAVWAVNAHGVSLPAISNTVTPTA